MDLKFIFSQIYVKKITLCC